MTFNDLLSDLTGKLPTTVQLPYGVRNIYTPVGGHKVRDIEDLQDGQSYVCAGFEAFKGLKYGGHSLEPWTSGKSHFISGKYKKKSVFVFFGKVSLETQNLLSLKQGI